MVVTTGARLSGAETAPPTTQNSGGAPTLDEIFATLDKNHDGIITKDEATGIYARRFPLWDTKGRGFVTRQEIHDFRISHGIDDNGQRVPPAIAAAKVLKEPADWRYESFTVPPPFAPDVKLTGTEEARFSKGMYDTTSDSYFTYAVAIDADGAGNLGAPELKDFLEKYFRGLSAGRARRTGAAPTTAPDAAPAEVVVKPADPGRFTAQIPFGDSFTDGRTVKLHAEIQLIDRPAIKHTILILLISPSDTGSSTWQDLREIGKKAAEAAAAG